VVFVEHTQEEADAVEAIQRHVTEKPQHDLAGVLENSVEDMAQLQSKSPRRHRALGFARSVSTYWEASSH
jgi:hypothetical protein